MLLFNEIIKYRAKFDTMKRIKELLIKNLEYVDMDVNFAGIEEEKGPIDLKHLNIEDIKF